MKKLILILFAVMGFASVAVAHPLDKDFYKLRQCQAILDGQVALLTQVVDYVAPRNKELSVKMRKTVNKFKGLASEVSALVRTFNAKGITVNYDIGEVIYNDEFARWEAQYSSTFMQKYDFALQNDAQYFKCDDTIAKMTLEVLKN